VEPQNPNTFKLATAVMCKCVRMQKECSRNRRGAESQIGTGEKSAGWRAAREIPPAWGALGPAFVRVGAGRGELTDWAAFRGRRKVCWLAVSFRNPPPRPGWVALNLWASFRKSYGAGFSPQVGLGSGSSGGGGGAEEARESGGGGGDGAGPVAIDLGKTVEKGKKKVEKVARENLTIKNLTDAEAL